MLGIVQTDVFNHMLAFLEYGDYESLRECCRRLHNHTSRLRRCWKLHPMGGEGRRTIAVCQFLKWATATNCARSTTSVKPLLMSQPQATFTSPHLIRSISLLDSSGRECCYNKWIDVIDPESMLEYTSKTISSEGCANLVCSLSHDIPVVEFYAIEALGGQIDLRCTLLSCSRLFGDNFLWKKEPYIVHLFHALADTSTVERRRDPMTRANEVIREVIPDVDRSVTVRWNATFC